MLRVTTPLHGDVIDKLRAGDEVTISGVVYTARDQAHQRLVEGLKRGEEVPFNLEGQVIYYAGPAPAKPGCVIGSAGPTTSSRMDAFTPLLLAHGLKGMIGKGRRSEEVKKAIKKHKAVYFATVGGAGALLSKFVKGLRAIAYEDLGPEAVFELEVENFPAVVAIDALGNDIYEEAIRKWGRPTKNE
jgi:fumarate hydratase subunit beta